MHFLATLRAPTIALPGGEAPPGEWLDMALLSIAEMHCSMSPSELLPPCCSILFDAGRTGHRNGEIAQR